MGYESPIIKFASLVQVFNGAITLKINDSPAVTLTGEQASKVACALLDAKVELIKQEI